MPYRYAHYFVLLLIPAAALGFAGYLSELAQAGLSKHVHAIAATLWIILLAGQSASIHNRYNRLHRYLGLSSLALFPVYLCGFFLVLRSEARRILDSDPWATVFGPGIGAITLISIVATAYFFFRGLRDRGNVHLHARWMLATVFLFAESVGGRILNNFVPALYVNDLDDVRRIYDAFHISQLIALALAAVLFMGNRRHGRPYLFVVAILVMQSAALELFDDIDVWRSIFVQSGSWPISTFAMAGAIVGVLVAWYGWVQGRQKMEN